MEISSEKIVNASDDPKKLAYKSLDIKVRNKTKIKERVQQVRNVSISVDIRDDKSMDQKPRPSYWNFLFSLLILAFCGPFHLRDVWMSMISALNGQGWDIVQTIHIS